MIWQATRCNRPYILPKRKRFLLHWETENGWWKNEHWTSVRYGSSVAQIGDDVWKDIGYLLNCTSRLRKVVEINDN